MLVGFAAGFVPGSAAGFTAGSHVGILSKFFIGNNLLLKLLRTFSLALNNILSYLKKTSFKSFHTFIKIL